MVTMIDEIFDRHYQSGRDQLNAAVITGLTHWDAPSRSPSKCSTGSSMMRPGTPRRGGSAATELPEERGLARTALLLIALDSPRCMFTQ